ncbi:MAG: glycosyltransferase family 1 protein [Candidatus Gracilibacteria bacterium]|nr:glycosyltransferase family 1 protein [Candidatus Gracilibacteria bacterium]
MYSPKYTGIGRYVAEFVKHAAHLDENNRFTIYLNPEEFETFQEPNDRWTKKKVDIPHYSLKEQTEWYSFLHNEPVDMMYFPHFNVPVRYKKPFVVTIHDLTLHYFPYKEYTPKWTLKKQIQIWVYKFIMKMTVKHAQHIIAISECTKKDLQKEYKVADEKVSVVYEGVPEHFQAENAPSFKGSKGSIVSKPYLIYTGVWRSHKNLLNLLKSFKKLVDKGHDIQLVITGKKDPAYTEIPALIAELELSDRVVLTGFVTDEELISLMSGAVVYVFPSLYEGFGLPPLEAMKLGVPVACSNRASLPEVCLDAALLFDPENVDEISAQIGRFLKKPQLRTEYIEKGKQNLKRFSWEKMTKKILSNLKQDQISGLQKN